MKTTCKLHKIILHKLEIWIPGAFGSLGVYFLISCRDWLNIRIAKLLPLTSILLTSEVLLLLFLLSGAYILLFRSKSKKEAMDLKVFVNKYVYSRTYINNPFITNQAFHSIDDHLSWRPFYETSEKKTKEQKS